MGKYTLTRITHDIHAFLHNRVYFFEKLLAASSQQRLPLLPRVTMDAHVVAALSGSPVRMEAQSSLSCSRYTVWANASYCFEGEKKKKFKDLQSVNQRRFLWYLKR